LLLSFGFKLCFQDLLSSFAFKLCFQALLSGFDFKLCFQPLLSSFAFIFNLRHYNTETVLPTCCASAAMLTSTLPLWGGAGLPCFDPGLTPLAFHS